MVSVINYTNSPKDRFYFYYPDYLIQEVIFQVELKRRPLYFMINLIFPCLVLNVITILSFYVPFIPQMSMCMSCFLTFSVYSLRISQDIPTQSEYLPMISLYFIASILFVLIAFAWFIIENYFKTNLFLPNWLLFLMTNIQKLIDKFKSVKMKKRTRIIFVKPNLDSSVTKEVNTKEILDMNDQAIIEKNEQVV